MPTHKMLSEGGRYFSRLSPEQIIEVLQRHIPKQYNEMNCLVMYDIEDNKVRKHIANFLIKKGCIRLQKSVYFGSFKRATYQEISQALAEVNEMYDNEDSIIVLPLSEYDINRIRIVGRHINLEVVREKRNLLFF